MEEVDKHSDNSNEEMGTSEIKDYIDKKLHTKLGNL